MGFPDKEENEKVLETTNYRFSEALDILTENSQYQKCSICWALLDGWKTSTL